MSSYTLLKYFVSQKINVRVSERSYTKTVGVYKVILLKKGAYSIGVLLVIGRRSVVNTSRFRLLFSCKEGYFSLAVFLNINDIFCTHFTA